MKLLTETKMFEGEQYYLVSIEYDPIWKKRELWIKMDDWCWDQLGPRAINNWPRNNDRWLANNQAFWFKNAADRTMFILKWAQYEDPNT